MCIHHCARSKPTLFRVSMCALVGRGRAIARGEAVLAGGMYLVGCAYNFCWEHDSLRVEAGRTTQVVRSDSGNGGRSDGPTLDDARVVVPTDPTAVLGRSQAERATAEASSGTRAGRCVTTVPSGATTSYTLRENRR